jgi:hypothetical protein
MGFGLTIRFTELLNNYYCPVQCTVTHIQSAVSTVVSSLAVPWYWLLTADIRLPLSSQTVPGFSSEAAHNGCSTAVLKLANPPPNSSLIDRLTVKSQSQITTVSQSASLSWCQAPI